jgi:hypothetical protein
VEMAAVATVAVSTVTAAVVAVSTVTAAVVVVSTVTAVAEPVNQDINLLLIAIYNIEKAGSDSRLFIF